MAEPTESPYSPLLKAISEPVMPTAMSVTGKVITAAMAIASISIGAVYFRDCPAQYLIPYYLIISGATSILLLCLTSLPCGDGREPPRLSPAMVTCQTLLALFQFSFFIAGNVWIYSIYLPNFVEPLDKNYCQKVLYLYAFWVTNVVYIFLGLLLLSGCCILICFCAVRASIPWGPRRDRFPS